MSRKYGPDKGGEAWIKSDYRIEYHFQSVMGVKLHCFGCLYVLTTDMFAISLTMFEFYSQVIEFAHQFLEALFQPPTHTCSFNKFVLDFLDVATKHGKDSDKNDSPSREFEE